VKITLVGGAGAVSTHDAASLIGPDVREAVRSEANAWIKRLRLVPYGSLTMRERFRYKNDTLWWFTELYLHKMQRLEAAIAAIFALEASRDRGAARVRVTTSDTAVRQASIAFGRAHGMEVEFTGAAARPKSSTLDSLLIGFTPAFSRTRRAKPSRPAARAKIGVFVHTAFWRSTEVNEDGYIGPVLDAVTSRVRPGEVSFVGVGPRRNFRARRWWDPLTSRAHAASSVTPIEQLAPVSALRGALALWRSRRRLAAELTSGPGIREAAVFRGCDLWPVLRRELVDVARVQWPWSARAMDEAAAALEILEPDVVVTYAEAGGWGRALALEARRRQIPSVGIQHGFIYRHWLNSLHAADELSRRADDCGFPLPDKTLVYDQYAAEHLRSLGHFPASRIAVTGNARLEELLTRCATMRPSRSEIRRRLGVTADEQIVVVAAKFSQIGHVLPSFIQSAASIPNVRVVIKTHPAETADVYAPAAGGQRHVMVASASADLAELLTVADAIVTMNSTVAIDGLALGIPALVIGLPNNLSPFVEAGVMLGADGADSVRQAVRSVLYDLQVRRTLIERADAFVARYHLRPEPGAAARAAEEILNLTDATRATSFPE